MKQVSKEMTCFLVEQNKWQTFIEYLLHNILFKVLIEDVEKIKLSFQEELGKDRVFSSFLSWVSLFLFLLGFSVLAYILWIPTWTRRTPHMITPNSDLSPEPQTPTSCCF